MKKTKVIHPENLPTRAPLWSSVVMWLLLDRLQPPGWWWGVVGTVFALFWISWGVSFFYGETFKKLWTDDQGDAMSLFERFMLWFGFVRTRRVLSGLTDIKETAWRMSAGQHIFGGRYLDLVKQHVLRGLLGPTAMAFEMDQTHVSVQEACEAFRKLGAGGGVAAASLTEGKMKAAVKSRNNTRPIQPPPAPAKNQRRKHG